MKRSPSPIGIPVDADGHPAGVVRFGQIAGHAISAAACRHCGSARFEGQLCGDEDAARWLGVHLADEHHARTVSVDLRNLPRKHAIIRRRQEHEVISTVARAWNVFPPGHSLVISWHADGLAA